MAKVCPKNGASTLYLDCMECDDKICKKHYKYKKVVIGIDQSYKNTGISIVADGEIKKVRSIQLEHYKSNSERRRALRKALDGLLSSVAGKGKEVICIIERIRLHSQGFLNIDYIKSIGALNALIIDACNAYSVPVFSVDTRCWKSQVVGTSKPSDSPKFAMEPEKYPTFHWLSRQQNGLFVSDVMIDMTGTRKKNNIFEINGKKYKVNDDACDSAGIAMFGFIGEKDKLKEEK